MHRALAVLVMVGSTSVMAGAEECADEAASCRDGCSVEYGGSVRDEMRAKLATCISGCTTVADRCRMQAQEVKAHDLDEAEPRRRTLEVPVQIEKSFPEKSPPAKPERKPKAEPVVVTPPPAKVEAAPPAPVMVAPMPEKPERAARVDPPAPAAAPPPSPPTPPAKTEPATTVIQFELRPTEAAEPAPPIPHKPLPPAPAPSAPATKPAAKPKSAPSSGEDHDDLRNY